MKKIVVVAVALMCMVSLFAAPKKAKKSKKKGSDQIKIGIINNPPSESGYRAAG